MISATTLKLPEKLKTRIARLATLTDRTPHSPLDSHGSVFAADRRIKPGYKLPIQDLR